MMKFYPSLWFLTTVMLSRYTVQKAPSKTEPIILVFGGTGFIGTEVVHRLLQHNYKPTLVGRGRWKFDSSTLIKPHVTHINCSRYTDLSESPKYNLLKKCPEFLDYIKQNNFIDFVIDLGAYSASVLKHVAELIRAKVGLYIYISSTAVYEVCQGAPTQPIKNTECVRPLSKEKGKELAESNSYAELKLQGEEYLLKQRYYGGFPYMILRIAPVIGPRDTIGVWWPVQLMIKYYHVIKAPITLEEQHLECNLVYTKDIAKVIQLAIEAGHIVHDQIYNLAFERSFHWKEITNDIAKEMKVEGIKFKTNPGDHRTRGPVDISKIKEHLGFQPEPWERVVQDTVKWYENAFTEYPKQVQSAINYLLKFHVPKETQADFLAETQELMSKEEL